MTSDANSCSTIRGVLGLAKVYSAVRGSSPCVVIGFAIDGGRRWLVRLVGAVAIGLLFASAGVLFGRGGVSKATFGYLRAYTWARVVNWLRRKHPRANWKWLRRRYLPGWWPTEGDATMFDPAAVRITYARYRGQITDATSWATRSIATPA